MKLQDPACIVMTRSQRNQRPYAGTSSTPSNAKGKEHIQANSTNNIEPRALCRVINRICDNYEILEKKIWSMASLYNSSLS